MNKTFSLTVASTDINVEVTDFSQKTCRLCASYDGYWMFIDLNVINGKWEFSTVEFYTATYPNQSPILMSSADCEICTAVIAKFNMVGRKRYRSIDEE